MSVPSSANLYGVAVGTASTATLGLTPLILKSAPPSTLTVGPGGALHIGQEAIVPSTNSVYVLTSFSSSGGVLSATWTLLESGGSSGVFSSLTVTPGPTSITGTTSVNTSGAGVTSIGTGGTGAVNIGNATGNTAVTGSLTASTGLVATTGGVTATAGNLVATAGNLNLNGAASKINLNVATGASASAGTATLSSGAAIVTTSAATTSSKIFVSYNSCADIAGTTACALQAPTPGAPGSFVITSQDGSDSTSTVNWWIIN